MKLSFAQNKKNVKKKTHLEINPRKYWIALLSFFILVLIIELIYFSWLFLKTTREIDMPAKPAFETNSLQIRSINKTLDQIETTVAKRTRTFQQDIIVEE